jgi:hypothetical protein
MNRQYWIEKLNINPFAEVIFYQSPEFYRGNSFEREVTEDKELRLKKGIIRWYYITGICNRHYKNTGKRQKICMVIEREQLKPSY